MTRRFPPTYRLGKKIKKEKKKNREKQRRKLKEEK